MFLENILFILKSFQLKDVLDISVIAAFLSIIVYVFFQTKSYKLLLGIFILFIVYFFSSWLNFTITKSFFQEIFKILPIVLTIVFIKEIRLFLIKIGFLFNNFNRIRIVDEEIIINEIIEFLKESQKLKIGSILVFENHTPLEPYLKQKIEINANLNSRLLLSIFNTSSPLHDGAVIIKKNKIKYASAVLSITEDHSFANLKKGTRHRAALGVTEESDSFSIVVSEESGNISLTHRGEIKLNLNLDEIRKILEKYYYQDKKNKIQIYFNLFFIIRFLIVFLMMFFILTGYWLINNYTKAKIQKIIESMVEFKNLNENLIIKNIEPTKFKITISGYQNDFKNFNENNVKLIIDLNNFEVGKYLLDIDKKDFINFSKNIEVLNIEPSKIRFSIDQKSTTTKR